MNRTCLDLFSGIGAHAHGVRQAGYRIVGLCEIKPFPRAVLAKNFPGVWVHDDVRTLSGELVRDSCGGTPFLITGSPPCQPSSCAGKQGGAQDARWLWPEFIRLVRDVGPRWFCAENPPGFLALDDADGVFDGLENAGYSVWPVVISAADMGAPHLRERVWIIGRKLANAYQGGSPFQSRRHEQRYRAAARHGASGAVGYAQGVRRDAASDSDSGVSSSLSGKQRERPSTTVRGSTGVGELANANGVRQPQPQGDERTERGRVINGSEEYGEPCAAGDGQFVPSGAGLEKPASQSGNAGGQQPQPPIERSSIAVRWPARRRQPQYDWEEPRLIRVDVERGLDVTVDGSATGLVRVADGRTRKVVRWAFSETIKAAGNAVVWTIPYIIAKAISDIDEGL